VRRQTGAPSLALSLRTLPQRVAATDVTR